MPSSKTYPAARSLYSVIFRRWGWIVGLGIVGGLAALGYSLLEKPTYEASTTVFITSGSTIVPTAYDSVKASEERIASYAQLVYSDAVLGPAVKAAGLNISFTDARAAVSVDLNPQIVMLTIHARDTNPEAAQRLGNALADSMAKVVSQLEVPGSGTEPTAKLSTVTTATVGASPVSPTTEINVVLGVAGGLVFGLLLVLVLERLNSRVRDVGDAQSVVQAPGLETIELSDAVTSTSIVDSSTESPEADAYRRLRSVVVREGQVGRRKILVTSARDGDGKTRLTINLGAALARAGNSVLLVDCDFRNPRIVLRTNGSPGLGITDAVSAGQTNPRVLGASAGIDGLSVLGAGTAVAGHPGDLMASAAMGALLNQLADDFDYVLIDSSGALEGMELDAISPWIDGAIVVARAGSSTVADLKETRQMLVAADLVLIGVVVFESDRHARKRRRKPVSA